MTESNHTEEEADSSFNANKYKNLKQINSVLHCFLVQYHCNMLLKMIAYDMSYDIQHFKLNSS